MKAYSPKPGVVILHARISDNVLDDEDWPIRRLVLDVKRRQIIDHEDVHRGAYRFEEYDPQKGMSFDSLFDWTRRDPTGEHPELYPELQDSESNFKQFFDFDDFIEALNKIQADSRLMEKPHWMTR